MGNHQNYFSSILQNKPKFRHIDDFSNFAKILESYRCKIAMSQSWLNQLFTDLVLVHTHSWKDRVRNSTAIASDTWSLSIRHISTPPTVIYFSILLVFLFLLFHFYFCFYVFLLFPSLSFFFTNFFLLSFLRGFAELE